MIIGIIIICNIVLNFFYTELAYAEYSPASSNKASIERNAVWP